MEILDKAIAWFKNADSPKGRLRFKEMALLGVVLLFVAWSMDSVMFEGWVAQSILQFSKASIGCLFTYLVLRVGLHERSHQLQNESERQGDRIARIIAYGFVIGCSLAI